MALSLEKLRQNLDEQNTKKLEYLETINSIQVQLAVANEEQELLEKKYQDILKEISSIEQELNRLKADLEEKEKEMHTLSSDLETLKKNEDDLINEINQAKVKMEDYQRKVQELQDRIEDLLSKENVNNQKSQEIRTELDTIQNQIRADEEVLKNQMRTHLDIQNKINQLERTIKINQNEIQKHEISIKTLDREMFNLDGEIDTLEQNIIDTEKEMIRTEDIKSIKERNALDLRGETERLKQEKREFEIQLNEKNTEKQQLETENAQSEKDLRTLMEREKQIQEQINQAEYEISAYTLAKCASILVNPVNQLVNGLFTAVSTLILPSREDKERYNENKRELQRLRQQISGLKVDVAKKRGQIKLARGKIQEKTRDQDIFKSRIEANTKQLANLNKSIHELASEKRKYEYDIKNLEKVLTRKRNARDEKKTQLSNKESLINTLKVTYEKSIIDIETMRSNFELSEQQLRSLSLNIDQLTEHKAQKESQLISGKRNAESLKQIHEDITKEKRALTREADAQMKRVSENELKLKKLGDEKSFKESEIKAANQAKNEILRNIDQTKIKLKSENGVLDDLSKQKKEKDIEIEAFNSQIETNKRDLKSAESQAKMIKTHIKAAEENQNNQRRIQNEIENERQQFNNN